MNNGLLGFPLGLGGPDLPVGLGYGQTWQDVSGSRSAGTTYYNTTGKPILVSCGANGATPNSTLAVNGVVIANLYSVSSGALSWLGLVPVGASYSVTLNSGTINVWAELR
jgi:hypothetical protein